MNIIKQKKVLFFENSNKKANDLLINAFIRKGYKVDILSPKHFDPKQDKKRDYDFIVFWGGLGKKYGITKFFSGEVAEDEKKVNALVLENAYSMKKDHLRITVNNPVGVYPFNEKEVKRNFYDIKKQEKSGEYILVISQNDSVRDILVKNIEKLKKLNLPIFFKQHPRFPVKSIEGVKTITGDTKELIKKAFCVVTHSSNCGNIALCEGVPVVCIDKTASFYNLSTDIKDIETLIDDKKVTAKQKAEKNEKDIEKNIKIENYFKRLSFTDWSFEEIANLDFMKYYEKWLKKV